MTAREAQLHAAAGAGNLRVSLIDGTIEIGNTAVLRFPGTIEQSIPLTGASNSENTTANPSHMQLCLLPAAQQDQRQRIQRLEQSLATEAAYQMLTGDFDQLTDPSWVEKCDELEREFHRLYRLETEPFRRWASGFSCLAFVMVGVPLAIRLRTSDLMTTFAICFLPILIVYYPLFAFGLDRAKNGALPPYVVWLGNLVCLGVGAWLFRKVARY